MRSGTVLLITTLLLTLPGAAQMTTGTILGTVEDQTGAVLPRAKVTVRNLDTGIARTLYSDETGRYRAPQLALGNYEVEAEVSGFQAEVRKGITITVGREAVVNFRLQVGEVTQSVEVFGEAPLIQTGTSEIGGLVSDKQIRDLPLNGRDFTQLILLQPGVVHQRFALQSPNTGQGARISAGGARMNYNNFLIDGTRKNEFGGTTTGSVAGVQLGVDAIQEFRVLTHNYSAEFGQNAGAIITAVTRAGTNDLHGSWFYFHRNDQFDARDFFDRKKPEFKRNQFGGSGGGPIVRERTFFFGAYEGFRERRGTTNVVFTPTQAARDGLLNDPATGQRVAVDPRVRPFLNLYPLPNGADLGGGSGIYSFAFSQPTNEDFLTARIDHRFSDSDSIFGRYQFSDADRASTRSLGVFADVIASRQQMVTLQEMHIFSPTVVNSLTLGFNRASPRLDSVPQVSIDPSLTTGPGRKVARITISGIEGGGAAGSAGGAISEFGPRNLDGGLWVTNSYQVKEDLNYNRGGHGVKTGVYIERQQYNIFQGDFNGAMQFPSLARFLQARPSRFTIESSDSPRAWRQTTVGLYVQDDWKMARRLTFNLGFRWEIATPHKDRFGRNAVLTDQLASSISVLDSMYDPGMKNFAPRLGFAWDVLGNGRTSLRGGAGIFHNLITGRGEFAGLTRNPPFGGTFQATNPPFPSSLALAAVGVSGLPRPSGWLREISVPTVYQYNLNLEQQLFRETVIRAGYVGSSGRHLVGKYGGNSAYPSQILPDGSKFFAAGLPVRNPNMGEIIWYHTSANSFYNAFELSVSRRASRGVQFQASYTFAKSVDDQSSLAGADNQQDSGFLLDPDNRTSDRGRSITDTRQNLVANFGYLLPIGPGQAWDVSGAAGKILGGWQFNGILTATAGVPLTPIVGFNRSRNRDNRAPDRPNLVPGRSNNPRVGDPSRWFDRTAFSLPDVGTYGNLGRSTVEGPGVAMFDFSIVKNTAISERLRTEFKAEFFNLFNRSNFGLPEDALFDPSGSNLGNAGRITTTSTTSREIQFGLKFVF